MTARVASTPRRPELAKELVDYHFDPRMTERARHNNHGHDNSRGEYGASRQLRPGSHDLERRTRHPHIGKMTALGVGLTPLVLIGPAFAARRVLGCVLDTSLHDDPLDPVENVLGQCGEARLAPGHAYTVICLNDGILAVSPPAV